MFEKSQFWFILIRFVIDTTNPEEFASPNIFVGTFALFLCSTLHGLCINFESVVDANPGHNSLIITHNYTK